MVEKFKLDGSLILPVVPDERDACMGKLTELLRVEGLEKLHLVRKDSSAFPVCTTIRSACERLAFAGLAWPK